MRGTTVRRRRSPEGYIEEKARRDSQSSAEEASASAAAAATAIDADEDAVSTARGAPVRPRGRHGKARGGVTGSFLSKIRSRVRGRGDGKGVPEYLVFNQHIMSGYRVNFTVKDSLYSLFALHNESINIWTHVFGFVLFLGLMVALCCAPPIQTTLGNLEVRVGENSTSWGGKGDANDVYREPIIVLQRARDTLGKALHVGEVRAHLKKVLADLEPHIFRDNKAQLPSLPDKFSQIVTYLRTELKRRKVGKALHIEEVKGKLLELETQLMSVLAASFKVEYWPMYIYLMGAMFCMGSSSLAHTFSICSPKANKWWWRIDYVGIAVMIATSFCPMVYYVFLNHVVWRTFYLACILVFGSLVACVSLLERFQEDSYRYFRAYLFIAFGMFSVFPLLHALGLHWNDPKSESGGSFNSVIGYELLMGVEYLGGTLVYATQFPECMFPGKFDLFFSSHQFFHVMIVFAAYTHYLAVVKAIEWRYGSV